MNIDRAPDPAYPASTKYTGAAAEAYDARRAGKDKWFQEDRILDAYISSLPAGSSLIDVPFGTGRFASRVLKQGIALTGVDISADMLAEAKSLLGEERATKITMHAEPAEKLPFENGSFDYLICNRFIKWLPTKTDLRNVVTEFFRVTNNEMFIQVKVYRPLLKGGVVDRWDAALKYLRVRVLGEKKALSRRYSMAHCLREFERDGWRVAETIDGKKVGPGVQFFRIVSKASD